MARVRSRRTHDTSGSQWTSAGNTCLARAPLPHSPWTPIRLISHGGNHTHNLILQQRHKRNTNRNHTHARECACPPIGFCNAHIRSREDTGPHDTTQFYEMTKSTFQAYRHKLTWAHTKRVMQNDLVGMVHTRRSWNNHIDMAICSHLI